MSAITGLQAKTEAAKKLKACHMGYLRMNIDKPACGKGAWGKYNGRPLADTVVQGMRKEFRGSGPLNCQPEKVIYLPVRKSWFEGTPTMEIDGLYIWDVAELKLTDEGRQAIADGEFNPLNGNHRRAAVEWYVMDLTADLAALVAVRMGLAGAEADAKDEEIAAMEKRLLYAPFWTVQLYDIGAYLRDCLS